MLFIKICGITRYEDALCAVESGANALGFVLAESKRRISLSCLQEICEKIPSNIKRVGVFVNPDRAEVLAVLSQVKLDYLQFHGQEDGEFCRSFDCEYIKAIQVSGRIDINTLEAEHAAAYALLLDTYDKKLAGGSGRCFNWDYWPKQATKPLILAGGLTPENVARAIKQVAPFGVDVSGGVELIDELAGGVKQCIKDVKRIKHFIQQVRSCS
ncbi:MAG: phosphoribosylanthranilate isomerase [Pseudomonadales bacterium]|nr:phosphoribosylanthranilate isomerase [Pseudomonadales bacterium]